VRHLSRLNDEIARYAREELAAIGWRERRAAYLRRKWLEDVLETLTNEALPTCDYLPPS
jgi:hypothetical protein